MKGGESGPDNGWPQGLRPRPEARPRGTEKPRWSAAGRVRQPRRTPRPKARKLWCATRRSIPLGLVGGTKGNDGVPGAIKNTGDRAWLFDN
jgi:hypothetical protein